MEQGLYHFDEAFKLLSHYQLGKDFPVNTQLLDILTGNSDELWVSSQNGLFRMQLNEPKIFAFMPAMAYKATLSNEALLLKTSMANCILAGSMA